MPFGAFFYLNYLLVIGGYHMNSNKKQLLQESWLETLGSWSKSLLKLMYGDTPMVSTLKGDIRIMEDEDDGGQGRRFIIRGKHGDVKAYARALVAEKNYIDAYVEYGNEHPRTVKNRLLLDNAIADFETQTSLIWPFRDEE
tara:strand:- start:497 stop:919 length:423 start_codon:yes stop_codon:yes gene_type:complete